MRDYLNRLRMQFQRFMIGRYGMDQFGRFLSSLLLALIIFNFLIPAALPSRILWALEWIVLIILYARMFSKNINKRYQENEAFLRRQFYVSEWWKKWKQVDYVDFEYTLEEYPDGIDDPIVNVTFTNQKKGYYYRIRGAFSAGDEEKYEGFGPTTEGIWIE